MSEFSYLSPRLDHARVVLTHALDATRAGEPLNRLELSTGAHAVSTALRDVRLAQAVPNPGDTA